MGLRFQLDSEQLYSLRKIRYTLPLAEIWNEFQYWNLSVRDLDLEFIIVVVVEQISVSSYEMNGEILLVEEDHRSCKVKSLCGGWLCFPSSDKLFLSCEQFNLTRTRRPSFPKLPMRMRVMSVMALMLMLMMPHCV